MLKEKLALGIPGNNCDNRYTALPGGGSRAQKRKKELPLKPERSLFWALPC